MTVTAKALAILLLGVVPAHADDLEFPRIIRTQYEAVDQKSGGQFLLWSEREKVQYGLDPKLYPGALIVTITQVAPGNGTSVLTYVEIKTTTSAVADNLYFTGPTRFRVSGMKLKASNFPQGSMSPVN